MLHGEQRDLFDLSFASPAECADRLASGAADIGIVPCIEAARQNLRVIRGTGIAAHGPVRSILLISKRPWREVRTLAADSSSRTSVQLARIILARKYEVYPEVVPHPPDLPAMLAAADAALIIGDPALLLDPAALSFRILDLGREWTELTGAPMVFAVWASRRVYPADGFMGSLRFGLDHLGEIVRRESAVRGIPETLAHEYLTRNIVFQLGEPEYAGMTKFLEYAAELDNPVTLKEVHV